MDVGDAVGTCVGPSKSVGIGVGCSVGDAEGTWVGIPSASGYLPAAFCSVHQGQVGR